MNKDLTVVCLSYDCIYRESCFRHLENINITRGDERGFRAEWYNQKEDECYLPIDGQQL